MVCLHAPLCPASQDQLLHPGITGSKRRVPHWVSLGTRLSNATSDLLLHSTSSPAQGPLPAWSLQHCCPLCPLLSLSKLWPCCPGFPTAGQLAASLRPLMTDPHAAVWWPQWQQVWVA